MINREDIKPKNLTVHEFLLRRAAVKLMVSEHIVEKVLSHEKKSINQAFKRCNEIEVSGFGKFTISQVKLTKKITKLTKIIGFLEAKVQTEEIVKKLESCRITLQYYIARVKLTQHENRPKRVSRRIEEHLFPLQGTEGGDRENIQRQVEDM